MGKFKIGDVLEFEGLGGSYYKDYENTSCKVIKNEGWHDGKNQDGEVKPLFGYLVRCEDGSDLIIYRGLLKRPWPKINRKDLDIKISWKDCPWMTFPDF